jgi:hypothetical protein
MDAFESQHFLAATIRNSLNFMRDSIVALTLGDPQPQMGVANLLQCDTMKKMVII